MFNLQYVFHGISVIFHHIVILNTAEKYNLFWIEIYMALSMILYPLKFNEHQRTFF